MKRLLSLLSVIITLSAHAETIDLSGKWDFSMGDKPEYKDIISLPGSMLTNHKGNKVDLKTPWTGSLYDSSFYFNPKMQAYREEGNIKFPFFLTPEKHYVGEAWYRRTVDVPDYWEGTHISLRLERPHIESTVYVNGKCAGRDSSLSVPHAFDLSRLIEAGKKNVIEIKVYNGIENVNVGQDSHSVTDQTQGNWNGIVGKIELCSRPISHISDLQIYPDVESRTVRVEVKIDGPEQEHCIMIKPDADHSGRIEGGVFTGSSFSTTIHFNDSIRLWDEFEPNLYHMVVALNGEDEVSAFYGMRNINIKGRQFYINGRPLWLRGTVENCCFPLTGYPPTDEESWTAIFNKCKEYGLNHIRFHSYCPPEAAFAAADKAGMYLQPEGPSWPNHGVTLGKGMSIDHYLMEETQRMVKEYGNHPSFCMLAAGNEPAGNWVQWVGDFVDQWRASGDNRRVYCGASVGGGWAWDPKSQYHVKGGARGLEWKRSQPQSIDDFHNQISLIRQGKAKVDTFFVNEPFVSHEQGQWCAFPDLKETNKYTGPYKAANFEIFGDLLKSNGMAKQAEKFLMASGKLQTLAYKYEIERNLRTQDYAGFQLLGLNDYSGQGTALVGVLNVFWQEKGYCDAEQWRKHCSPIVPLAKFPKFVFTNDEKLQISVDLYNAYNQTLTDLNLNYRIKDATGKVLTTGTLYEGDMALGKNQDIGKIDHQLDVYNNATKLTLEVYSEKKIAEDLAISNSWDFWVYPKTEDMHKAKNVYITDTFDKKAEEVLEKGGKVLLTAAGKIKYGNDVVQNYLPVFWNTSWFQMKPPHTTGVAIETSHPLFKRFMSDDWANLNWWQLINNAGVINLSDFPEDYQSPVQPIDTWHISRKLGMVVEANVLKGKLLLTTMDIDSDLDNRVVARSMRNAILQYMDSQDFNPNITMPTSTIRNLFEGQADQIDMHTASSPDELKPTLK